MVGVQSCSLSKDSTKTKPPSVTNLCPTLLFFFKRGGGQKKKKQLSAWTFPGSWHGYQANSPGCKNSRWSHPTVHFLSPLLLQPGSRGDAAVHPSSVRARAGVTPQTSRQFTASRGDKLASATHGPFQVASQPDGKVFGLLTGEPGVTQSEAKHAETGNQTQHRRGKQQSHN